MDTSILLFIEIMRLLTFKLGLVITGCVVEKGLLATSILFAHDPLIGGTAFSGYLLTSLVMDEFKKQVAAELIFTIMG